jgi:cytochrome c oxidase assembly protein Cox11
VPVKFIIDPELPKNIASLALGYTLFDVTEEFANLQALN